VIGFHAGALPDGCDCARAEAFAAAAAAGKRVIHGVPRYDIADLPADVRSRIAPFVRQDDRVYAAGFRRFAEAARAVEDATGTRQLCASDITPATRAALDRTDAGARLLANLDAAAGDVVDVVTGGDACPSTCDTGEGEDSATWYLRETYRTCRWIGKQSKRKIARLCEESGTDGKGRPRPRTGVLPSRKAGVAAVAPACDFSHQE